MKKIFLVTMGLVLFVCMNAQILKTYTTTLQGKEADTITLNLMTGLDYLSLQFVPTHGATLTDSLDFSYVPYVRNTYTGSWTAVAAADTVSGTTAALVAADTDAIYNFSPWLHIQGRLIVTGISTDTVLVTVSAIQKR